MPDPQTPNLGLFVPLNGADVGTWDVPMNANFNLLDSVLGANTSVVLSNVPVTLSPAQYQNTVITFTGTLTADVVVTFPAVGRIYNVFNNCTANTAFRIRAQISSASNYVALPPSEITQIAADGSNMRFMGLGRVGTYWDFAGSAVPIWVTGSNPQPYLNCDGTAFSSATYPALRDYLGGTTLPDSRGRYRAALNQATARLPAFADTLISGGGSQIIAQANIPNYALGVSQSLHSHGVSQSNHVHLNNVEGGSPVWWNTAGIPVAAGSDITLLSLNVSGSITTGGGLANITIDGANANVSVNSGGSGTGYAPPSYAGGLTLIRAG